MDQSRGVVSALKVGAAVVALLVGTVGGAFLVGALGTPSVVGVDNRFGTVTDERSVVESDLTVDNPNPVGVRLGGATVTHTVSMNDVRMASGAKEGIDVGTGTTTLSFTTAMNNSEISAWWVTHVRNGEHTGLRVNASVHSSLLGRTFTTPDVTRDVDTDVIGAFRTDERRPVNASVPLADDPVAYVERTDAEWETVNETRTEVNMTLYVHNPKSHPLVLSEVGYDLTMNGVAVGNGSAGRTTTIPPGETVPVEATTGIRTQRLDEWWVSHLRANQVTDLRMQFYLVVDLSAVGAGERRVDVDEFDRTIETDLFGTKDAPVPADTGSDGDRSTASDDSDASDTGDAGTDTPTGTERATPTGTSTPTADGTDAPTTPSGTPAGGTPTDDGLLAVGWAGGP